MIPRSMLDGLLMQVPALICILRGPEHIFELVNPGYAQLFPNRELIGKAIADALPELDGQPFFGILDRVYETGESFVGKELRAAIDRHGNGPAEEGFFNFTYQAMRDGNGTIDGILVFAFEVTELVESRRKAEALARSLQHANREKDHFVAAISHELRTPLTSILGWTRMLKLGGLDDETFRAALDAIDRSTTAQAQLIDDLLDESRIAAGKLRLETRLLRIEDVINTAMEMAVPSAELRGVRLATRLAAAPMSVRGDPARLQQVMNNLLSNAIKFTPQGGAVSVTLNRHGSFAAIEVADTGRGIRAEFLPYVFDRFRQDEHHSSGERRDGLGLGLSIVRHLVGLHGGTVRVTSGGTDKGTTFIVELPLADMAAAESLAERDEDQRYAALPSLQGVGVLVVEDEHDNRQVLTAVLHRCGAEVMSAATVDEALAVMGRWRPDVILSDIFLAGSDGYELLRHVRELPEKDGGTTPAMALSVHARPNERERALQAGFAIFRQKPIEPADLAFDIARLAHKAQGSVAPSSLRGVTPPR